MSLMGFLDKYFIKKPLVRRFLTKLYYGDKDRTVQFFNTKLYINTIKENGYLRAAIYSDKSSVFRDEVPVLINLASFMCSGTSFIDIGANVGLYSYTFERFGRFYRDFKIYAFEPNPDTFKRLLRTAENTGIKTFNYALSDEDKELEFAQGAVSHVFAEKNHINLYHIKDMPTVKVQAKRLDGFDIEGNSIILKIDVEGHELEVLEGARNFFDTGRIKLVYLDGVKKRNEVLDFLKEYGFNIYDGKTFQPDETTSFSLLAVNKACRNK